MIRQLAIAAIALAFGAPAVADRGTGHAAMDRRCSYSSRAANDVVTTAHCARIDAAGHLHIAPRMLHRLTYDRFGLSEINVAGWYRVRRDGLTAPVMTLDNWAEPFSNGLARSPLRNRIGYIDRRLRRVIPARFDGAFPFDHGVARVCEGCRQTSTDNGEYHSYAGGRWGRIDRRGRFVVPLRAADGPGGADCARHR